MEYVSDRPHETISDSDLNDACLPIAAQESTSYFTTNKTVSQLNILLLAYVEHVD